MIRTIKLCLTAVLLFVASLVFPIRVYALSILISNLPSLIDRDQEIEVELYFNCAGCGDSYMRGVFYPSGTNYFGFTQNNGGNWVGTSTDRSLYYLIAKTDLIDASWSGKLKIKPDSSDPAYTGPGEYLFKIGRYTSVGDSSADWSNELAIKITGPTPTPSPSPTPSPTSAPSPTPTPTKTPTPVPTPTKTPTLAPTKTPIPTPTNSPVEEILGAETIFPSQSPEGTQDMSPENIKNTFPFLAVGIIALGLGFMGFSVFTIIKGAKKSYTIESEKEDNQIS